MRTMYRKHIARGRVRGKSFLLIISSTYIYNLNVDHIEMGVDLDAVRFGGGGFGR